MGRARFGGDGRGGALMEGGDWILILSHNVSFFFFTVFVHLHLHLFMYEVVGLPCGRLGIPLRCFDNVHRIRVDVSSLSAGFP